MESIYLVAFITGLFYFLSPCIIPMLTVYFTLIFTLMGLVRLSFLSKFNLKNKISIDNIPTGYKYLSTFLVGVFFAVVCSHCIGATLYSMLILTGTSTTNGSLVMLLFSLGLAIPYFLVGLAFNKVIPVVERLGSHQKKLQIVMGLILIAFGVLMITNEFTILTKLLNKYIPFRLPYSM